jgi:hypothetical protein
MNKILQSLFLVAIIVCNQSHAQPRKTYGLSDINTEIALEIMGQPVPSQAIIRQKDNKSKFTFGAEGNPVKILPGQRYKLIVNEIDEQGQKINITQSEYLKFNSLWKSAFHVSDGYLIVTPAPGWQAGSSEKKSGKGHLTVEYVTPAGKIGFTSIQVEISEK